MQYWYFYRPDLYKLVTIYDHDGERKWHDRKPDAVEKMKCNIRRAQRMIEGYALCNDWDWFGTFTLSPAYRDRADLDGFHRDIMQFIRHCRRKYGEVEVLLVPELHKKRDGWHMHGLLRGIPLEALELFDLKDRLPKYIRDKLKGGGAVYDWPEYRKAFGWVDIEPIRSRDAAARYITKYITKDKDSTAKAIDLGKHLYYRTKGLIQPLRLETENAPGCVPEAFPSDLVAGKCFPIEVNGVEYGTVQWFVRPSTK